MAAQRTTSGWFPGKFIIQFLRFIIRIIRAIFGPYGTRNA
jgi:hypothetical protein